MTIFGFSCNSQKTKRLLTKEHCKYVSNGRRENGAENGNRGIIKPDKVRRAGKRTTRTQMKKQGLLY
jgi:hypothetical protein